MAAPGPNDKPALHEKARPGKPPTPSAAH